MSNSELKELDKLEEYLKENHIPYVRIDERGQYDYCGIEKLIDEINVPTYLMNSYLTRHQIFVPCKENPKWDVICQPGSYGYEDRLLELMGDISRIEGDVEGFLTAEDVIERINNA